MKLQFVFAKFEYKDMFTKSTQNFPPSVNALNVTCLLCFTLHKILNWTFLNEIFMTDLLSSYFIFFISILLFYIFFSPLCPRIVVLCTAFWSLEDFKLQYK